MTKLWRAATTAVVAAALVVGPAAIASADTGRNDGAGEAQQHNAAQVRAGADETPVRDVEPASDVADPIRDRDRVRDVPADRPEDPVRDRATDRDRDCTRDTETGTMGDCDSQRPEIRPILARCIDYIQNHTDRTIQRSLRWWWHVCHRLAWNHANPE